MNAHGYERLGTVIETCRNYFDDTPLSVSVDYDDKGRAMYDVVISHPDTGEPAVAIQFDEHDDDVHVYDHFNKDHEILWHIETATCRAKRVYDNAIEGMKGGGESITESIDREARIIDALLDRIDQMK